nr:hypothetical protein [Mycobacteroides abscessus]
MVDISRTANAVEQLLECNTFRHFGARATRFDVFVDDLQVELSGFSFTGSALSRNGDAFGVVIGLDLPLG